MSPREPHPLLRAARAIDALHEAIGRLVAWLVLGMTLLITYDVAMRRLFQSGSVALQELEWHLFAVVFLLGAAYTLKHDDHVRVDILYRSRWMTDRRRAWVNLLGTLLFLIPFCLLVIIAAGPYVQLAFTHNESSPEPGGLPWRWILKSMIPVAFAMLLIQGIGLALKSLYTVLHGPRA